MSCKFSFKVRIIEKAALNLSMEVAHQPDLFGVFFLFFFLYWGDLFCFVFCIGEFWLFFYFFSFSMIFCRSECFYAFLYFFLHIWDVVLFLSKMGDSSLKMSSKSRCAIYQVVSELNISLRNRNTDKTIKNLKMNIFPCTNG